MLLKEFNYNEYRLVLNANGMILLESKKYVDFGVINIVDVPIINELQKELLEYYVEWKKNA